jgi:uncharacterized protein YjbJ (UPF0337 family)
MATEDKLNNKADELEGRAKRTVGEATGDEELRTEGQTEKVKANLKQAGEKIKDAFRK